MQKKNLRSGLRTDNKIVTGEPAKGSRKNCLNFYFYFVRFNQFFNILF